MLGTFDDGLDFVRHGGLERLHSSFHYDELSSIGNGTSRHREDNMSTHSSRSNSSARSSPSSDTGLTSLDRDVSSDNFETPLFFMFLGSSLGNFGSGDAANFLKLLPLRPGSNDRLLIGLDHDNDKLLIEKAYNDSLGITRDFIMNGLNVAGRILGNEGGFDLQSGSWEYVNFYNQSKSSSF